MPVNYLEKPPRTVFYWGRRHRVRRSRETGGLPAPTGRPKTPPWLVVLHHVSHHTHATRETSKPLTITLHNMPLIN